MRKAIITLLVVALTTPAALGQGFAVGAFKPTTGHAVRNYSWNQPPRRFQTNTQHTNRYQRPVTSVRDYTINKYFAGNPRLSPYLHLTRPQAATGLNNYHRFVVPEVSSRTPLPDFQRYVTPWNR